MGKIFISFAVIYVAVAVFFMFGLQATHIKIHLSSLFIILAVDALRYQMIRGKKNNVG